MIGSSINKIKSQKDLELNQIQHPEKVKVLILTSQRIQYQQFSYLKSFKSIVKLDLSYNKISSFPNGFSFNQFNSLRTLFLHYNKFDKLKNIQLLSQCKELQYLTLFGNPIEQALVRHFIINIVQKLKLLDDKIVKIQQKYANVLNIVNNNTINHQNLGFPLIQINNQNNKNNLQILSNVYKQLQIVRNNYKNINPIIKIQLWWKKIIKNKNINKININIIQLQNTYQLKKQSINKLQQTKIKQTKSNIKLTNQIIYVQPKKVNINKNQQIYSKRIKSQISINSNISQISYTKHQKVFNLLLAHSNGLQIFKYIINQQQGIYCTKKFCIENNYKFTQDFTLKGKNLHLTRFPQQFLQFNKLKQSIKQFFSLLFYNNSHYIIELKDNWKNHIYKKKKKNISDDKCIVQIIGNKHYKLNIINKEYHRVKLLSLKYLENQENYENINKNKPFQIIFASNIIKISAALKIQKLWKGYQVRKQFNVLKIVKQLIATKKIQKWLRKLMFQKRQKFLLDSYIFMKNNQSNNISLKLSTFSGLGDYYTSCISKKYFLLPFQNCNFEIVQKNKEEQNSLIQSSNSQSPQVNLQQKNKSNLLFRLNTSRQPYPSYFTKFCQQYQLSYNMPSTSQIQTQKNNIIDLLIKGSKSIKRFTKLSQNKRQKEQHILFQYFNKQNASQRKLLLCLFTYNIKTQKWIEFKSQTMPYSFSKTVDINQKINHSNFIRMVFDSKKDKLYEKIQKYTKQKNIIQNNKVKWTPMKIRYFQGNIDHSAIFIIGDKSNLQEQKSQQIQNKSLKKYEQNLNLKESKSKLKQLYSIGSFQNKYILQRFDSDLPSINRNIIQFNIINNNNKHHNSSDQIIDSDSIGPHSQRYGKLLINTKQNYQKILQNDISHTSLDISQNGSINRYGLSMPIKKRHFHNNKNQYSSISINQQHQIIQKKAFIQKLNNEHKMKIQFISQLRKKQIQNVRKKQKIKQQQNLRQILQNQSTSLIQNIKKVKNIKNHSENNHKIKQDNQKFQNHFVRKGNLSMRQQLKQFQKSRSKSKQVNKDKMQFITKKSSRYQQNFKDEIKMKQYSISVKRNEDQLKNKSLKTQLKQFSIQFSQSVDLSNFDNDSHPINILMKQSRQLRNQNARKIMNSATSQKITKLYNKKMQKLKSQHFDEQKSLIEDNSLQKIRSSNNTPKIIDFKINQNIKINQFNDKNNMNFNNLSQQNVIKKKVLDKQIKNIIKKNKVVHSVFPQQFYPLKDAQLIGFCLPKIKNQNKIN